MDNLLKSNSIQEVVSTMNNQNKQAIKDGKIITDNCKLVNVLDDGSVEIKNK